MIRYNKDKHDAAIKYISKEIDRNVNNIRKGITAEQDKPNVQKKIAILAYILNCLYDTDYSNPELLR